MSAFIKSPPDKDHAERVPRLCAMLDQFLAATGERSDICSTALMHVAALACVHHGMPKADWLKAAELVFEGYQRDEGARIMKGSSCWCMVYP